MSHSTPPEPGAVQQECICTCCIGTCCCAKHPPHFEELKRLRAALSVPSGGAPTTKEHEEEATRMDSQCDPGTSRTAATNEAVRTEPCTVCQMRLPERLVTFAPGPRGGIDAYCAACGPRRGLPVDEAKRQEVIAMRKARR